jgi:hypothetical protein
LADVQYGYRLRNVLKGDSVSNDKFTQPSSQRLALTSICDEHKAILGETLHGKEALNTPLRRERCGLK